MTDGRSIYIAPVNFVRKIRRALLWSGLSLALSTTTAFVAHAAGQDANVLASTNRVLSGDVANANFGQARRKLQSLLDQCRRPNACTPNTTAQVQVALAAIGAQLGETDDAKAMFIEALRADPLVPLPSVFKSPAVKSLFAEAQKIVPPPPPREPKNDRATELVKAAGAADEGGATNECVEKSKAAIAIEDSPQAELVLATCLKKAGQWTDAIAAARKALQESLKKKDAAVTKSAAALIEDLLKRIPRVVFAPPQTTGVKNFKLTFDGKSVPAESWNTQFVVNPGSHQVHAEGVTDDDVRLVFDETYAIEEGSVVRVPITLKPESPKFLNQWQIDCMKSAKTQDDVLKCLPSKTSPLVIAAGLDTGIYTDTTATRVYTSSARAGVRSPTGGWNVGGSYVVDVVTSASPDVVSTASRKFSDLRHAVSLSGGYKPGRFGASASGEYSVENDYISRAGFVSVSADFMDKQLTPSLGVGRVQDTIGRAGQGFDQFSNSFYRNEIALGATVVLTASSIFSFGLTGQFERGDQSKPYRLIPMFDTQTDVPVGASVNSINANRLPVRPYEQLPLERDRYALALRYARRTGTNTLRLEQRFYRDTWAIWASTTDARYVAGLTQRWSVWPHVRLHGQTGANFYERAYHAEIAPVVLLPKYRTTDRELTPFVSVTLGAGTRYELAPEASRLKYAVVVMGDVMGSRYFDALYIVNRLAVYGTVGLEATFE